jgi:protease IV
MKQLKRILVLFAWAVVSLFALVIVFLLVGILTVVKQGGGDDNISMETIKTDHAVAVVELTGEMLSSDAVRKSLKKVIDEKKIKAVVVRIDSPGGSVGAAEEAYRAIKESDQKKPVVCSLGNIAASGGLYAAVGCRKILANAGTLTGSIGVILMMPNLEAVASYIGVQMNVIKSGKFKDTGSPFRKLDSDDRLLLQSLVDKSYQRFVQTVADGRHLEVEKVKTFADGRIILGEEAVEKGLVDQIGGLEQAAKAALELAGDSAEPEIITLKKATGLRSLLSEWQGMQLIDWISSLRHMRLLYQAYS